MARIQYSVRKNTLCHPVSGQEFVCLELHIPRDSHFMRDAIDRAERLMPRLNAGQANSSERRQQEILKIDNLSGMIAELACLEILGFRYGRNKIDRLESLTGRNQIDLRLYNGKTMEVRSSCVRNGVDFALFARNKDNPEEQYFDVIGPYSNGYKKGESFKDYYVRALYECEKRDFLRLLEAPFLRLYLTGGATKQMMQDESFYQIKHLIPAGGQVQTESDYRVIPLEKSLDICRFFKVLEEENEGLEPLREFVYAN